MDLPLEPDKPIEEQPKQKADEFDEPLPPPATPEEVEKAERLIRESRLQKMRNNKSVAGKLLEEALEVAPGSVAVLEAVADDLLERRQTKAAMEIYKRALRIDPKNASVERKYAECVLGTAVYADPFAMAGAQQVDAASGKVALMLSIFIPGLGQIVIGSVGLGAGLLAGWLLGWAIAWLIPGGMAGIMGLFGVKSSGSVAGFNGAVLLPLMLAAICHIWAIFDAAQRAQTHTRKKLDRPVPPVDKDFEL